MKKIMLLPLLFLTACEGSTARGFWGPSVEKPLCTYYGNCNGGSIWGTPDSGAVWGPADSGAVWGPADGGNAGSSEPKGCELYGNCDQ